MRRDSHGSAETLNIPKERVYIEFSSAERHMFGWNGKTFEK
ncbi:MAG: hypothetical protein DRI73_07875 [Bacteroidetes bacterium]|nr:MAG: hypothetical protein DRI73_07875 [Bacteroidota bacterium]